MRMDLSFSEKNRSWIHFLLVNVLFCMLSLPIHAQNKITVTGSVSDSTQEPLVGASVVVKGTTQGVVTDIDGNFEIQVASEAELEVSYIGYITQTVPVMNRANIKVVLEPDAVALEGVIAIGYGTTRKEDLSMAVSTMKVDNSLKSRSSDIATMLQGRLPGVTVLKSGDPMKKASMSIRGRGSKGNDDDPTSGDGVLFVVDGVPNAPYMVEDIESITILKDAASAAIYGASVGSSGVVLITTKQAKSGKVGVNVNASWGIDQVSNLPTVLTAEEFNATWAKAIENSTTGKTLPSVANPELFPFGNVTRTDWLDEIFRLGFKQHYGVSVTGGTEKIKSVFSASYDDNKGVLLNTWAKTFGGKLHTDFQITPWLKLYERVSVNISRGQGNVNTNHEGPIMGALWYPRYAPVYEMNEDGSYALDQNGERYFGGTSPKWSSVSETPLVYNPVAALTRMHRRYPESQLFSTTGIQIQPIKSLIIKSEFTADTKQMEEDCFYPKMEEAGLMNTQNFREQYFNNYSHWLSETTISWDQTFGKHRIGIMGGFTADWKKHQSRAIFTRDYPSEEENQLLWGLAKDYTSGRPREAITEYAMASFLARASYSYDDRYFLTASIRRDASSKLPASKNFDWFPSVSGSWKLSSEHFYQNSAVKDVMNLFKIRAGWGKVGNVDLFSDDVTRVQMLNYDWPIIFGKDNDQQMTGTYLNTIPNMNARWETTVQTSVGLDLGFFQNALEISLDWYNKQTRDLIDVIPTPQQIGVQQAPLGNMGKVINTGWELTANYNGEACNGDFTYNVWGNYSYNKGWVDEYGHRDEPIRHQNPNVNSNAILYSQAGQPWYSFMVYQTDGIFRSQDEIDNYTFTDPDTGMSTPIMPTALVGDLKFKDTNNDGVINESDMVFAGSYAPVHTYSFGASLNWKGLDFSIMFQGVAGNKIYNGMKQMGMNGRDQYGNLIADVKQCWDFDPQNSKYPRLGIAEDPNGNYSKFSDIFLEKGDYLRLKNITLGYTLPRFVEAMPAIRFYFSADNLATFTKYTGVDPEVGNYGVDRGVYPVTRFYNFGININF